MYIFNSGIKFDRNLFRVPAVTHVCFYSIFLYVYLRVFAFGLFFISLQYYTKSGYSTQPVVLVRVWARVHMHFIVCVCLCSMCLAASTVAHWQVGLWHLQYINTPHNTSALCKLSPSHTSAFLSLVSIFSPHLPRLSLSHHHCRSPSLFLVKAARVFGGECLSCGSEC